MASVPFADRVSQLRPTAVNRVLQEVRQLQSDGHPLFSLMRGQPDTPTPAHIVEAATRSIRDGRTGYPDNQGEPALRRAVALKLKRDLGLAYDPDREILITDGATLGVCTALGALVDHETRVLLPDPIYDAYQAPIALWGGTPALFAPHCATADSRSAVASLRTLRKQLITSSCSIHHGTP